MRYLDVCAGISAPTVAWKPLGWQAVCYAEIADAPRAVLSHHYPDVPLVGDFTEIRGDEYGPVDLLVGGTPCQSFSIAGLRGGLADDRGNLALEYLRLADRARPRWLVWENVPGVLSSNGGRDFGSILGGMGELGYGVAYRVLNAQHFGVPQRRRRVFVVGYLGDWRRAAAVLFERHSLSGDTAPRREAGQGVAGTVATRTCRSVGADDAANGHLIAPTLQAGGNSTGGTRPPGTTVDTIESLITIASTGNVAHCLNAGGMGRQDYETETLIAHSLRGEGFDASEDGTGRGTPLVPVVGFQANAGSQGGDIHEEMCPTLRVQKSGGGGMPAVAFAIQERAVSENLENGPQGKGYQPECAYTLEARNKVQSVAASAVRRLTPMECERLQGFPDNYTLVPHRGRMMADGPRYKCLGNSMAVPVVRWIGERIEAVEALSQRLAA